MEKMPKKNTLYHRVTCHALRCPRFLPADSLTCLHLWGASNEVSALPAIFSCAGALRPAAWLAGGVLTTAVRLVQGLNTSRRHIEVPEPSCTLRFPSVPNVACTGGLGTAKPLYPVDHMRLGRGQKFAINKDRQRGFDAPLKLGFCEKRHMSATKDIGACTPDPSPNQHTQCEPVDHTDQ